VFTRIFQTKKKVDFSDPTIRSSTEKQQFVGILIFAMDLIPQDVWPLIASFLDDKTRRQLRLANTKWFNIIKYNNFRLYFTRQEDIPAITERLSKYSWPIKITFVKSKFNDLLDVIDYLPKLTNLIKLKSDSVDVETEQVTHEQWMQLSVLTNLEVWIPFAESVPFELWQKLTKLTAWYTSAPEETLAPVLKHMANLKSLNFFESTKTWPFALVPNPEKLTFLHMSAQEKILHGSEMWSRLTNLKYFSYSEDVPNSIKLSCMQSLEYLSIYSDSLPSFVTNTNLTELRIQCTRWSLPNAESIGRLQRLEILHVTVPPEPDYAFQFQLLSHLPRLASLSLSNDNYVALPDLNNMLYPYIPQHLRALLVADIESDIEQLTHLTNLESLTLLHQTTNNQYLSQLSNMTYLYITHTNYDQDFRSIAKLTRLQELHMDSNVEGENEEIIYNIPDLSELVDLKSLHWGFQDYPVDKLDQLKYLTKLEELAIGHNDRKISLENCDFLAGLTNLTYLKIDSRVANTNSLWHGVAELTKLQQLVIYEVDYDDNLLLLSPFRNLTLLEIRRQNENRSFKGVHLTAITSLQSIYYHSDGTKLAHKRADILKSMPYLLTFSYFVPLT
jgi:hypothetical protein